MAANEQIVLPGMPAPQPQDKWERLLQLSIERGASAETFSALVDSIMKARKEDARLQFEVAHGRFKNDLPAIFKNKKVTFPNKDGSLTEYSHAELAEAAEICAESLSRYGLTYSWRPSEGSNGRTIMTCVFRHPESGHVEEMAVLGGPPENSGSKNNLQAIGSTVTYLQRYTLLAACGIAPKGLDDDGRQAEGMPENSVVDYCIQMQDSTGIQELQGIFKDCYLKSRDCSDKNAMNRFIKVYNEKKKALRSKGE
jgi:hypothetical protein